MKLHQLLNLCVLWKEMRIVLLNHSDSISQPLGNLEYAHSFLNECACEGMSHNVSGYPTHSAFLNVSVKRKSKLIPVSLSSLFNGWLQGEIIWRFFGKVSLKKFSKAVRQRNKMLFIFKKPISVGGCDVNRSSGIQIKPSDTCLDDFVLSHSGVKSGQENKKQIIIGSIVNKLISFGDSAKLQACRLLDFGKLDGFEWIPLGKFFLYCPRKKCSKCADVNLSSCFSQSRLKGSIIIHGVRIIDICKDFIVKGVYELFKNISVQSGCMLGINVELPLVGDVFFTNKRHLRRSDDGVRCSYLYGSVDSHNFILGFQGNIISFPVFLESQPVNVSSFVDSFSESLNHCHTYCHTFAKMTSLHSPIKPIEESLTEGLTERKESGQRESNSHSQLGRLVNLLWIVTLLLSHFLLNVQGGLVK